jgi:prevent-host-death family protein
MAKSVMTTKNILSITEARQNIFKLAKNVQKEGVYYTLVQYGRPKAVLMSADEFESWQETMDVLREMPDLPREIKKAREEFKRGEYVTLQEVLAKEGYVLADKAKNKYVPSGSAKKRAKIIK